jgi:hypothetical protein
MIGSLAPKGDPHFAADLALRRPLRAQDRLNQRLGGIRR